MGLNRSSRPHRSGPVDHDVFEGLPVRRWARQLTTVSQEPKSTEEETNIADSQSLPELPMPRDSNLLTPVSRALLRAARAGCTYIRPVRKDPEPEELEQKDDDDTVVEPTVDERMFAAMKWTALPRTVELPEVEFLAPRRSGLPSLYGAGAQSNAATAAGSSTPMRKTKFKKIDPTTGIISIYEAWVPEGYQVEGEIIQEAQVIAENPDAKVVNVEPAPGTVVADIGVVNQDGVVVATAEGSSVMPKANKGKRKLKAGKAKSRKKVMFASGDGTGQPEAPGAEGPANPSVSENGATPSGTVSVPEDEEEDEEEGDESDEEDETATDSKPTPTADGPVDENNTTPASDVPSEPQDIPQQPPTSEKESIEPTPSEPPQTTSKSPDLPILTSSTSERHSKSPTEEPKEAPASTEPSNEAVPPTEAHQADPETVEQAKISPPPVSAAEDAKAASPVAPLPESLDDKMDTAEDEAHHQPTPEKAASPPASAKEEQVSPPTIPPSTTEAESKPQTPPDDAHTSNPLPESIPASTPTTGPSEQPAAGEPAGPSSPPPPPETSAESTADSKPEPTSSGPVRFEDGEVDLLGSLEASLGKGSDTTVQDKPEDTSDTAPTTTEKKEDDTDTKPEASPAKEEENKDDKDKDVEMTG
ncbi:hypothetical protein TMEN_9250 [Trichophyton mentagrophytes]|uniref:LYR family protein n=1 Tax=Trichophyton interdigitale (strain MR816) TaxID=1215338 RepID=A0A059J570_TRIIM|nr:hypothetical protein H109_05057 [Trichophyton interdigitale MR816]GBF66530.1 hypothetical protein TMEN_9250 [Trichophyton mentagrophytes]